MSATPENVKPVNGSAQPTTPPEQKRSRGRPRADGSPPGAPRPDSSAPRPERPNKRRSKVSFDDAAKSALALQIQGLHEVMALTTGIRELALHPKEAEGLAGAVASVCEEYDLALDGKTGALVQLAAACGMIYVPRYFAFMDRVKKAKQEKDASALDHVSASTAAN